MGAQLRRQVVAGEGAIDERFHVAEFVAGVVAKPSELDRPDGGTLAGELAHGVGEPDLAAATGPRSLEHVEDLRLEDVAMHGGEVARCFGRRRLFDDRADALRPFVDRVPCDDAIGGGLLLRDPDAADDAPAAEPLACLGELRDRGQVAQDDIVAPEHRERFRADHRARLEHGVAVALGLLLHDDANVGELLRTLEERDVLLPALEGEPLLEPTVGPEVRADRLFPRSDDDDDLRNPRRRELGDDHLDDRRVDHGEELFRHDAADRKKPRPETTGGYDAPADRPESAPARRHQRASALTVKAAGCVVRTARPVTASSGGRRSAVESISSVSCPLSTIRRSTVGLSAKRSTCTMKRCATTFVERTKPDAFQPLSDSASSTARPGISMSSIAKPPRLRLPSVTYWKRSWICFPANDVRSAESRTQAGPPDPPETPVRPLPRFCPFGSVLVDASVRSGTQWAPPSTDASTYA